VIPALNLNRLPTVCILFTPLYFPKPGYAMCRAFYISAQPAL
jgi:hypothetical protein